MSENTTIPVDKAPALMFSLDDALLTGPWGVVFGPMSLKAPAGNVVVLKAPPGAARTALLLTLSGRMILRDGKTTVLGFTKDSDIFKNSAVAFVDEVDFPAPSVTIRDLVTEQLRWSSPWYKWVPQATQEQVELMCKPLFQDIPVPPMDSFINDLPLVQQAFVRIAVANVRRPPLLVVGRLDLIPDPESRRQLLDRLRFLSKKQAVITVNANAGEFDYEDCYTVEVPDLLEFLQHRTTAQAVQKNLDSVVEAPATPKTEGV